jgi:phage tail tape-measure protein
MRKVLMSLAIAGSMSLGACATPYGNDRYDRYGDRNQGQMGRTVAGAAIGAAAGAGVGAVVGGVSAGQGAAVGGLVGAAVGAATSSNQRWYPDNRGDCYYVNDRGERIYDYGRRC